MSAEARFVAAARRVLHHVSASLRARDLPAAARSAAASASTRVAKVARPLMDGTRQVRPRWGIPAGLVAALTAGLIVGLVMNPASAAGPASSAAAPHVVSDRAVAVSATTTDKASSTTKVKKKAKSDTAKSDTATATDKATKTKSTRSSTHAPTVTGFTTTYGQTISPSAKITAKVAQHLPLPAHSGVGRRIVYSGAAQHLWIVASNGTVLRDYPVTGRSDRPSAGKYRVYSKSEESYNPIAKVTFTKMVRFAWGITGASIGFHTIPKWYNGKPLQTTASLGLALGRGGCIRQAPVNADYLYSWSKVGDRVVVVA